MIKKFLYLISSVFKKYLLLIQGLYFIIFFSSCNHKNKSEIFIPKDIVIAHRGTTYWAPEETESAYRWARDIGAHYLEVDIQRSKDGVLMALHDNRLTRTTDIAKIYPVRDTMPSSEFTFEELLQLDAGSWFNKTNPDRSKQEFSVEAKVFLSKSKAFYFDEFGNKTIYDKGEVYYGGKQQILALEDVIRIAEGYRIAKDVDGNRLYDKLEFGDKVFYRFYYVEDIEDSENRPGVYIETKEPQLFPGVEKDLFDELDRLNWNQLTNSASDLRIERNSKVNIANTPAKIILQTFSPNSLKKLYTSFKGEVPTTFLLWLGDANMPSDDELVYSKNMEFARKHGVQIIGPSIGGKPNNYSDLLEKEHYKWIKNQGFLIHPYSFDTKEQMEKYGSRSDGMFTNRAELTLEYYKK